LSVDADHCMCAFGPLLVNVWMRETRIEALLAMEGFIGELAGNAPNGLIGLFVVVEPNATIPTSAARAELSRIRRSGPIALTALVYEGTGFGAALVRGVTTSLNLLERGRARTHIFESVTAAAAWIHATAPEYGGGAPLEAAIQTLRTSLGAGLTLSQLDSE
jgi:hypothetical protein